MIAYGVCVGSWDKLQRFVLPHVGDRQLLGLSGQTSIASAYNAILNAYRYQDLDYLILQHDDLEITDPDAEEKFLAAVSEPSVALVGVAGGTPDPPSITWWENGPRVGWQMTDSGPVDFGERKGDVLFIEGSIMVFSPWAIRNLRFDTRFQGFLGYDEICVQAVRTHKKRVIVTDVDTYHHSTVGFKSDAIQKSWWENDRIFREKWGT